MNLFPVIISNFLLPLALTEIVEPGVAFLFGLRRRVELAAVLLINLITNPVMNYVMVLSNLSGRSPTNYGLLIVLEVLVVFSEWLLMWWVLVGASMKFLLLSLVMNVCSCAAGLLILPLIII